MLQQDLIHSEIEICILLDVNSSNTYEHLLISLGHKRDIGARFEQIEPGLTWLVAQPKPDWFWPIHEP